jgi:hypothetical protein
MMPKDLSDRYGQSASIFVPPSIATTVISPSSALNRKVGWFKAAAFDPISIPPIGRSDSDTTVPSRVVVH